ncbi:MAG: hypothetical protein JXA99_02940 [Candidatus Lokiarchaeota archaeon]|nr:hypothetical protein [Candidatus Lokiarchaeota archaeon]
MIKIENKKMNLLNTLMRIESNEIPVYCTGYPKESFMKLYQNKYNIISENNNMFILKGKDYSLIDKMGFDAISIWDFRRGIGGYRLDFRTEIDGWGRIMTNNWYTWDGVFKDEKIINNWNHLTLPSERDLILLARFLRYNNKMGYVLSLPGLFEKTWQSMGFIFFSKCLKKNIEFIRRIIDFFYDYIIKLIKLLQKYGVNIFLIADDLGYNNRSFIQKNIFFQLFLDKYKNLVNFIHDNKNYVIIHSDGYISNFVDLLIDIGFDGIQSIEPNAGNNIFELFRKFGDKICFIGNLDNGKYLTFGTTLEVRQYAEKLIKKAKKYNSFLIISPTQQINEITRPENIYHMIKITKLQSRN